MEELIKQAFLQVETLGPHVQEGHYDLIGPNGEIILPSVWEKVVEPDWAITMTMWPIEKMPPPRMPGPGGKIPMHGGPIGGRGPLPGRAGKGGPMPMPPPFGGLGKDGRVPEGVTVVNAAPHKPKKDKKSHGNPGLLGFIVGGSKPKRKYVQNSTSPEFGFVNLQCLIGRRANDFKIPF
jgi:hypothetical protein